MSIALLLQNDTCQTINLSHLLVPILFPSHKENKQIPNTQQSHKNNISVFLHNSHLISLSAAEPKLRPANRNLFKPPRFTQPFRFLYSRHFIKQPSTRTVTRTCSLGSTWSEQVELCSWRVGVCAKRNHPPLSKCFNMASAPFNMGMGEWTAAAESSTAATHNPIRSGTYILSFKIVFY